MKWIKVKPGQKLPADYEVYERCFLVRTNQDVNGGNINMAFIDSSGNWCTDMQSDLPDYLRIDDCDVTHYAIISDPCEIK